MSDSDLDERVSRLETLMERLVNVQLSTQSDIGFLAQTLGDTRKDIAALKAGQARLENKMDECDRKLDIVLQRLTGGLT